MDMRLLGIYGSAAGSWDIRKMFPDCTVEYTALGRGLFSRTEEISRPPITAAFYHSLLLAAEDAVLAGAPLPMHKMLKVE